MAAAVQPTPAALVGTVTNKPCLSSATSSKAPRGRPAVVNSYGQAVVPQLPANGASSAVQLPELLNRLAEVLPSEAKGRRFL